jgi:IgA Peptidase M64.
MDVNTTADWLSVSPLKGSGDAIITVTSELNKTGKDRSGVINICPNVSTSDVSSISVTQKSAFLNFAENSKLNIESEGGDIKVEINSSVEWSIKAVDGIDWIFLSPERGSKNQVVTMSVSENINLFERSAKLIVTCKVDPSWTDTLEIHQKECNKIVDGAYTKYLNSSKAKPARLIIMGDGYNENDINKSKKYDKELNEAVSAFFSVEPYSTYKDYFEVYKVYAISKDTGISDTENGVDKDTRFSSKFEGGVRITTNSDEVFKYAKKIKGITDEELKKTAILLIINEDKYAGVCYIYGDGKSIAICPVSRWGNKEDQTYFNSIILHEAGGHGWGQLADEYILPENEDQTIPQEEIDELVKNQKEFNIFMNVTHDKNIVPWEDFIEKKVMIMWDYLKEEITGLMEYGVVKNLIV